jgi:signal transduction histidine kinase
MIAKELFNNVLKHAQARHVDVTMRIADGAFELIVADDGRGFSADAAAQSARNGLKNLRARAVEVRGAFDLTSTGSGTTATLRFPVPAA